ncbi:NAD(P)H-hydrate dehydratase [Salinibacterium sp. NSLL150]|uniref:ADP-dependent NAD(P)H-hydrate dehydratase n=1 Tax=unclassified Salinibacterium TaxID=2632331 RepID=UPI0018CD8CE7|nr:MULTISPECIES: ADP/ATP-dependent (S)-NAD(P)H-hydrate dehydratase [unclassified Salinibacterium]MBH0100245.1 NAD(P)H-hydrate dehydratase [Salinibacterium sp. NSLL35]MBH0102999.1 NAD(P)H-hydrate dehydratase [Salinibacterium sp. NSLL150]MBH0105759.1 NAD(P)H-hydrate dehydratase [Salinibacterium sp. NSLL16]MBH0108519.1 NAD(P)H-hydrate dehydratase [Salinibacterium sp. NSLL17]
METELMWGAAEAARHIALPQDSDDKYSRGVLGLITGSAQYPGAAVIGVEAAARTGVGMIRYLGAERAENLILQRRPEAVMADGRVQAWLIGSGMDHADREPNAEKRIAAAISQNVPIVLDGGALDVVHRVNTPTVITPHYRELSRLLGEPVDDIAAAPRDWAQSAATTLGCTVLLKGHTTYISDGTTTVAVAAAPAWLATAGAGDALGGILGALVATHSDAVLADPAQLVGLAAAASYVHGRAAQAASAGGPLTILDLCAHVPPIVAELAAIAGGTAPASAAAC